MNDVAKLFKVENERQRELNTDRFAFLLAGFPAWHLVDHTQSLVTTAATYIFSYFCVGDSTVFFDNERDNDFPRDVLLFCRIGIAEVRSQKLVQSLFPTGKFGHLLDHDKGGVGDGFFDVAFSVGVLRGERRNCEQHYQG